MKTKVETQNQRIERLERAVFGQMKWVKIAEASQLLGIPCSTLRRKCDSLQFKEGKCWRWNYNKTQRFFNVYEWQKAMERWS